MAKINYFAKCFFLKLEINLLINAAPTPRQIIANIDRKQSIKKWHIF